MQGICAVLGCLALYHHPYDNIMLYLALLAIFANALRERLLWTRLLALAMAFSFGQRSIWLLVGFTLLVHRPEQGRETAPPDV